MTPAEIAGRLDERFRLLRAGRRTRVERHQTLRAAIDWSYDALSEGDQRVFAQLAVFSASFTASAAQIVVGGSILAAKLSWLKVKTLPVSRANR